MAKGNKKSFKNFLPILIPVLVAIIVVAGLAVAGAVTKNKDKTEPTYVTETQQAVTEATTQANSKVTIVAVGDNLIHNTCIDAGLQEDGTRDYSQFYENMEKYIKSADIACIDCETLLGGSAFAYSGYPCFNTPWEVGDAAVNAGFDVFTCATNHVLDMQGFAGIEQEINFFKQYPEVTYVGINETEEDSNTIDYVEKNGIKFAILNYTFSTNGISLPSGKEWSVNMLSKEKSEADIKVARENADVVIVFPHWGTEDSHIVNDEQKEYVKLWNELGVDIVIGGHPHVLQPVEWVTNDETGKKTLVYYSLGNFISHQIQLPEMCGGMAEITVERVNGEIQITNAKLAPVIDYYVNTGSGYKFTVYKLSDYTDELASKQAQSGATVDYFTNLSKDVVSEEFLDLN